MQLLSYRCLYLKKGYCLPEWKPNSLKIIRNDKSNSDKTEDLVLDNNTYRGDHDLFQDFESILFAYSVKSKAFESYEDFVTNQEERGEKILKEDVFIICKPELVPYGPRRDYTILDCFADGNGDYGIELVYKDFLKYTQSRLGNHLHTEISIIAKWNIVNHYYEYTGDYDCWEEFEGILEI